MDDKFREGWKILIIAAMVIFMLIPIAWISLLIQEREKRKETVLNEIAQKWGQRQLVTGPFIQIPYEVTRLSTDNMLYQDRTAVRTARQSTTIAALKVSSEKILIQGRVESQTRKRGIYKASAYVTNLQIIVDYSADCLSGDLEPDKDLLWDSTELIMMISDRKGLRDIKGTINDQPLVFSASDSYIRAKLPKDIRSQDITIEIHLELAGTQRLAFRTSAIENEVELQGNWASPSFIGNNLPVTHSVGKDGFSANWKTSSLSSGIDKYWSSSITSLETFNFGVQFLIMIDSYQQTTRALKYSILFILLTFMLFFFTETVMEERIHYIQYLMVGSSLILFFLLLLSLSEHIPFIWAYLIAAIGIVLQITAYSYTILKTPRFAVKIGLLLVFLYILLFILLSLEDIALLVGSISLFALLSIAMHSLRNVEWYKKQP